MAGSATDYIKHHLTHAKAPHDGGFWSLNVDTFSVSLILGFIFLFVFTRVVRNFSVENPGRLQCLVESIVEMVGNQVRDIFHAKSDMVAPLALTVFCWVFLMNAMDMLPVDALPQWWHTAGPAMGFKDYMRVVPTADLSTTLGLSTSVLLVCLFYNIKIKGLGGWAHELVAAPFGDHPLLYPINFLMQMIEFIAKTVSHGMRLFGNMYAGELVFMLIALMGAAWAGTATGVFLFAGHVIAGSIWAIFHILIVALQAFIFMMLTLVYIGQAHEAH